MNVLQIMKGFFASKKDRLSSTLEQRIHGRDLNTFCFNFVAFVYSVSILQSLVPGILHVLLYMKAYEFCWFYVCFHCCHFTFLMI